MCTAPLWRGAWLSVVYVRSESGGDPLVRAHGHQAKFGVDHHRRCLGPSWSLAPGCISRAG